MGKEQPAAYYDKGYAAAPEYSKHYQQSRYYKLWQRVESHLIKGVPVLDIGCGPGQLGHMLTDLGYKYHGIDFSETAIIQARKVCTAGTFEVADIFSVDYSAFMGYQVICCETLEHVTEDRYLLELIKQAIPGANIVITVPSFDDAAHVRYFKNSTEAISRYAKYTDRGETVGAWFILNGNL